MTITELVDIARERLVEANHGITKAERRLFPVTGGTQKKLTAVAKQLSEALGFTVFPMQVAGILVETVVGTLVTRREAYSAGAKKP